MSRLFLIRFSFLTFKNIINSKINLLINLSIFIIIFALTASAVSILFENRIEQLESRVTKNEINNIVYTKWLNKSPKIIININNIYQARIDEKLFTEIIKLLPDDDDHQTSQIYSSRYEYYMYYYFLHDFVKVNFKSMDIALTDAILLADSKNDIDLINIKKNEFYNLVNEFDINRSKGLKLGDENKLLDSWSDGQLHYTKYSELIKKKIYIIDKQRLFFLKFVSKYFSTKRDQFIANNKKDLTEIKELATLETRFILSAFVIQFLIFILLQIFEVTVERGRKNEKI
ncbi:hypothetical protein N9570_04005 [Candidatus Pelagibacter sp.]|nr:hypothetical protein [Candidatus Pelagibacter sp.]